MLIFKVEANHFYLYYFCIATFKVETICLI